MLSKFLLVLTSSTGEIMDILIWLSCNGVTSEGFILEECNGENEGTVIIPGGFGLVFLK